MRARIETGGHQGLAAVAGARGLVATGGRGRLAPGQPPSGSAPRRARRRPAAAAAPPAQSTPRLAWVKYSAATEKVLPLRPIYDIQSGAVAFPRIASLKTAQAFRARLAALSLALPFDESLQSAPTSPLVPPNRGGRSDGRQPLVHPADGRVGRHARRTTQRVDHSALAALRPERRQADLGRRSRGGPRGRPGQPQPTGHPRGHGRRSRGPAPGAGRRAPRAVRRDRRSAGRAAAHALGPLLASLVARARRRALPTATRCSTAVSA